MHNHRAIAEAEELLVSLGNDCAERTCLNHLGRKACPVNPLARQSDEQRARRGLARINFK